MSNTLDERIRKVLKGSDALMGDSYVDELKSLILSEIRRIGEDAIGEDEYSGEYPFDTSPVDQNRNELREEQRQRLLELTGGTE